MWIRFKNQTIETSFVISPKLVTGIVLGLHYSDSIQGLIKSFFQ